jgi:hypothetical protein
MKPLQVIFNDLNPAIFLFAENKENEVYNVFKSTSYAVQSIVFTYVGNEDVMHK